MVQRLHKLQNTYKLIIKSESPPRKNHPRKKKRRRNKQMQREERQRRGSDCFLSGVFHCRVYRNEKGKKEKERERKRKKKERKNEEWGRNFWVPLPLFWCLDLIWELVQNRPRQPFFFFFHYQTYKAKVGWVEISNN